MFGSVCTSANVAIVDSWVFLFVFLTPQHLTLYTGLRNSAGYVRVMGFFCVCFFSPQSKDLGDDKN